MIKRFLCWFIGHGQWIEIYKGGCVATFLCSDCGQIVQIDFSENLHVKK